MATTTPDPATLRLLRVVLATKIVGTVVLFCVPMLFLGTDCLADLYGLRPEPLLMARLVGGAYAALIVGYASGWVATGRDLFPTWVVAMGIVSNGGGAALAAIAIATGDVELAALRPFAFAAVGFAGLITLGLVVCLARHQRSRPA